MSSKSASTLAARLLKAMGEVDRPGAFCASGDAPSIHPGVEIEGVGLVGLPLSAEQAQKIKGRCVQAPYGKGTKTVLDTKVRRVWKLRPGGFKLSNPSWEGALRDITAKVEQELGLEGSKLEAHLHDLLLYEKGGFFLPHRDGEKLDGMVATLVIALPSDFSGGELVVRHEGEERVVDFAANDPRYRTQYAAFYADCEHEVKPLASGYRLCLIYNLTVSKATGSAHAAPKRREVVESVTRLLGGWDAEEDPPLKLAMTFEHQYTKNGLTWDALKGIDRTRAQVLAEAARSTGCHAYLVLLTLWESGSTLGVEDDYGHRYGGRSRGSGYNPHVDRSYGGDEDDRDDDSGCEMDEIFEHDLTADHWQGFDGGTPEYGALPVREDEAFPQDSLREGKVESRVHGYTGNEGLTLERWYRRAAILLWPEAHHFDVLCGAGEESALAGLSEMIAVARKAKGDAAFLQKQRCREFMRAILSSWRRTGFLGDIWGLSPRFDETPLAPVLSAALRFLDDSTLYRIYIRDLLRKDALVEPDRALIQAIVGKGWDAVRRDLSALFSQPAEEQGRAFGRNTRLLDLLCAEAAGAEKESEATLAREVCHSLAEVVGAALEKLCSAKSNPSGRPHFDFAEDDLWSDRWKPAPGVVPTLAVLVRALATIEADDLLQQLVAHMTKHADRFPLQHVQIPVLIATRDWAKQSSMAFPPALSGWVQQSKSALESLTASQPQPPRDFQRDALVKCNCTECAELNRFLADPALGEYSFQRVQERRTHLENQIRGFRCDVDCRTNTRPRPQILICTKNTATYERHLAAYRENVRLLGILEGL